MQSDQARLPSGFQGSWFTQGFMCRYTDGYKPHVSIVRDVNFHTESQEKTGTLSKLWLNNKGLLSFIQYTHSHRATHTHTHTVQK